MTHTPITRLMLRLTLVTVVGLVLGWGHDAPLAHSQPDMSPRSNLPEDLANVYDYYEQDRIEVKFRSEFQYRLRDGRPTPLAGAPTPRMADRLSTLSAGGQWQRSHTLSEERLAALQSAGQQRSGRKLPDLNSYLLLRLPHGLDAVEAVREFASLDVVDAAYLIPRPAPVPEVFDWSVPGSVTGNLATDPYQGYLDSAPDGVDARWAWTGIYGTGSGMRICDVEYDYNADHEDLPPVTYVGAPKDPPFEDNHGTAVLGILGGLDNNWGVTGIAHDADLYFAAAKTTTGGYDVGAGVIECADALNQGDIILIEQQTSGPNRDTSVGEQFGLVPVEWYKPWYDDIVTAIANGMVVVEAAGNGSQDLDSADYQVGNGNHYPFLSENDSGAIIVGAGKSPAWGNAARSAHDFSNYGSTVDMQGWGGSLLTTGYGDLNPGGAVPDVAEKNLWYRRSFGGTSGASPMVTAAAAIVQANYKANDGSPATAAQIKDILRSTGTAQTGTKTIGPLPDLRAAIPDVWDVAVPTVAAPTINPASGSYDMPTQVTIDYGAAGQNSSNTHIRYTLDGSEPTLDSFIFIPEQGDSIYLNYGATVRAKAFQSDPPTGLVYDSQTTTATYESTTLKVETPEISPAGGFYNQPHQVTITTDTPDATIRYRTDGRSPSFFYPGTLYDGPITLEPGEYQITARAYKDGYYKSDVADSGNITVNPTTLPTPTVYPGSGNYVMSVSIYIDTTVLGAQIRYTTDGSDPTESSFLYDGPLEVNAVQDQVTRTVKARAFLEGYTPSPVASATYTVVSKPEAPTIDPSGGEHTGSVEVTLDTATEDAVIRYSTVGVEPTELSEAYNGPFTLDIGEHEVWARAFLPGALPSEVTKADFTVYSENLEQVEAPTFDPRGGNHTDTLEVRLDTDTEDAEIYYIIDSSNEPNTLYTEPILLQPRGNSYSVRARAKKAGMADSDISATSFFVASPVGTVEPPDVDPPSGTYTDTIQVTIDGHTNPPFTVRQIYHTTNGEDPEPESNSDNESSPYDFNLSTSTTVKAVATQLGYYDSDVVTRDYEFQCDTVRIEPLTETQAGSVTVTLSTTTPGETIYYTTDGSAPTTASDQYSAPFTLPSGLHTVRALCIRNGFQDSNISTRVYDVQSDPAAPDILTQPASKTVVAGTDVTYTVVVTGSPYPAVQWQHRAQQGSVRAESGFLPIAGETEPTLDLAGSTAANAGEYRAVVSNATGVVTSSVATLSVQTPLDSATVEGITSGLTGQSYSFNANVSPPNASTPFTYTWAPEPDSGQGTASATYRWDTPGTETITVTVQNPYDSATDSHEILISDTAIPLDSVTIDGASQVAANQAAGYTAATAPATATMPITYTWDPAPDSGQGTSDATYSWDSTGTRTITVSAQNSGSTVTGTHTVTVTEPVTVLSSITIDGVVEGHVDDAHTFATTITPPDASTPITYTWDPAPDSGQGTESAVYTWDSVGTKQIMVTAQNEDATVTDTHEITITEGSTALSSVAIDGVDTGSVGATYPFTAVTVPASAATPISYTWEPEPDSGQGARTATYGWDSAGTQTITVTAQNPGGTVSASHAITIAAASTEPVALTSVEVEGPATGVLNTAYSYTATVSPAGASTPITYTWSPEPQSGQGTATVSYTWSSLEERTIQVTASNAAGSVADELNVTVTDAPVRGLAAFNDGPTPDGSPTLLTAVITGGSNVIYSWDFGDGQTATGAAVEHTYAAAGIYTATVTASNSAGNSSATTVVDVGNGERIYMPLVGSQ